MKSTHRKLYQEIWVILFAVSCFAASAESPGLKPLQDIHADLLRKYTPIDQSVNDVGINHSGEEPFAGDCDDYYAAAFNQMRRHGYDPFAYILGFKKDKRHIVACVKTNHRLACLDPNQSTVSSYRDLQNWYRLLEIRRLKKSGQKTATRAR